MMPTMPPRGSEKFSFSNSSRSPIPLAQVLGDDHLVAQALGHRDQDFHRALALALRLGAQLLVAGDAGLALGVARLGAHAHPLELALEGLLPGRGLLLLGGEPLLLLLQPARVVALPRDPCSPVELQDPLRDIVEEVAVVGDRHHGARKGLEELLEPGHALGVEVVGGLVEQQHVGLLQQQAAERHPAPLATGDLRDVRVARRKPQRVHRDVQLVVELPGAEVIDPVLQAALLLEQLVHRVVVHRLGELHRDRVVARRAAGAPRGPRPRRCRGRPWRGRAGAPAGRNPIRVPARGLASPMKSLSTPAMIRSRVDFPAPFDPRTPILAPG